MNQQTRQNFKLILMIGIYVLLGIVGVYSFTLIFLAPLLMTPMAIFLMGNKKNYKRDLFIHLIISMLLYVFTNSIQEVLLYIVSVAVPAHIFVTCYRKKLALPQIAMYTGVGMIAVFYLYIIGMKYMQVDYIQMYNSLLDAAKSQYEIMFNELVANQNQAISAEVSKQLASMKRQILDSVDVLKYLYPTMLLQTGVALGVIGTIFITFIGRLKKWRMLPLVQFANFKFSKWMSGLLLVSGFVALFMGNGSNEVLALATNLYFFTMYLLQIIGLIASIMFVKKSKLATTTRTMVIVLCVLTYFTVPFIMMIVGLADTLFNFRKVDIIV
nr:DUF2232 domain-containing protein [uncultured Niameybacter sp.]